MSKSQVTQLQIQTGSTPAPGVVLRALAENSDAQEPSDGLGSSSASEAGRAARPATPGAGVLPEIQSRTTFAVRDYDLAATLNSGQAFRWNFHDGQWQGIISGRWVRLRALENVGPASSRSPKTDRLEAGPTLITAETAEATEDWNWLTDYLQLELDLSAVLATFPDDEPIRASVNSSRGLRLLRQEPWECLASFILSSTKQIVQIRQIVALLCERFGEAVPTATENFPAFSFPTAERLAHLNEADLRACKMGFRAPYLLATARRVAEGKINLDHLRHLPVELARQELMTLPGVGRKIADCVLLFAYGFQTAFPVDVWVVKALQQLYFPKRRASAKRLRRFAETHFGPNAGYAQQYLFHYMRTKSILARGKK